LSFKESEISTSLVSIAWTRTF